MKETERTEAKEIFDILDKKFEVGIYGDEKPEKTEVLELMDKNAWDVVPGHTYFDDSSIKRVEDYLKNRFGRFIKLTFIGERDHVWDLEKDVADIDLAYKGRELLFTDKDYSWAIFVWHEGVVFVAGSILEDIKKMF